MMKKSLSSWFRAEVADRFGINAANFSSKRIYREAAFARKGLFLRNRRKGREHQELPVGAGCEVITLRFEIGPEAARNYRNKRQRRFAHGLGDGLLARRDASGYRNSTALSVKKSFFNNCRDFALARSSRNLDKHFIGRVQEKVISYGITPFIIRERDRARYFEKFGILHDSPASFDILMNVGCLSFKLTFRKENRVVKAGEPEGRRTIKEYRSFKCGIGLGACDFEAADDFSERRIKALVNPDNPMEMFGHYRIFARLNFGEDGAEISPSFGNFFTERREGHFTVNDFAENGAAFFNRKRNHINPWLAIIPTREANSRFKMTIFIAAAFHGDYYSKKKLL